MVGIKVTCKKCSNAERFPTFLSWKDINRSLREKGWEVDRVVIGANGRGRKLYDDVHICPKCKEIKE